MLKKLYNSYTGKTPSLWRRITKISFSLKGLFAAILGIHTQYTLPGTVIHICGWGLVVCVVLTFYSEAHAEPKAESKSDPCDNPPGPASN